MELLDYADGIQGHFCIGRRVANTNFFEFYNKGSWASAGQVFTSEKIAEFMLKQLRKKYAKSTNS